MFDGSETSIYGNGSPRGVTAPDGTIVQCACVDSGPDGDWSVRVGPTGRGSTCLHLPNANGLEHNPHCLERFFDPSDIEKITYTHVTDTPLIYERVPSPRQPATLLAPRVLT
ncbi:hypothetical protein DOTSEDRAFT_71914 [Dothistroma septosporum NZE10]|uniref:Uncharacterized protein n=1 Tax=Dothistroma septosporum (strain NZE10 / CBS 128990) TaxID=675120 RepID=N1PP66_DOTSN|nr:hypothetical protein DOTSEDRAFT_71914 [Dothistroma septosporum NZE10]